MKNFSETIMCRGICYHFVFSCVITSGYMLQLMHNKLVYDCALLHIMYI